MLRVAVQVLDITAEQHLKDHVTPLNFNDKGVRRSLGTLQRNHTTTTPAPTKPTTTLVPAQVPPDLAPHAPFMFDGSLAIPWGEKAEREPQLPKWNADISKFSSIKTHKKSSVQACFGRDFTKL